MIVAISFNISICCFRYFNTPIMKKYANQLYNSESVSNYHWFPFYMVLQGQNAEFIFV